MIIGILLFCTFIIIGIMLSLGKWSFLLAGFNTMSKEEKAEYDMISVCKFTSKIMFIIAFSILLSILSDILMMDILLYIGVAITIVSVIFTVVYSNTGNRFKIKK